jgi:prevent-host-death family protein
MASPAQVSQRDLRNHSKTIMDAVEQGQSFVITRDGHPMGELIPLRRRFVSRIQFVESSQHASKPNLSDFRSEQETLADAYWDDPYDR